MKKILFMLVLLLTSCTPPGPKAFPTQDWTNAKSKPTADWSSYAPNVTALESSEQCPHLCWLGINPGLTTVDEAKAILSASDQINPEMEGSDTGIVVQWYTEKTKALDSTVYLRYENGIIKSISFTRMAPFTLKDFIAIAGDPSGVNIDMNIYGDVMEMPYGAYYFTRDILIGAEATEVGLHPNDPLTSLVLNVPYKKEIFRTWEGYGHLAEYFKGKEVHQHPAATP